MLVVLLILSFLLNGAAVLLLIRGAKRLLQMDDLFQQVVPMLEEYGEDLRRMSSADMDGILVDHPEVLAFHKRNLQAKLSVELLVGSITNASPRPPRKRTSKLPMPEAE